MNLVESVFEIAESFMANCKDVVIDNWQTQLLAARMKEEGPTKFPPKESNDIYKTCLLELIGNSINYCYWYGRHDIRPNGASSTTMFEVLDLSFEQYRESGFPSIFTFAMCIEEFIAALSYYRFPMLEERANHLRELIKVGESFVKDIIENHTDEDFERHLKFLVCAFPGYGSDMFLKRASLFFLQLYRNFGWFKNAIHKLPVPADYQVPKMLAHYGCISYSQELQEKISKSSLIQKHSREECEIRAATILACKRICDLTEWNISDVDGWLWLKKRNIPFHLCITTDY